MTTRANVNINDLVINGILMGWVRFNGGGRDGTEREREGHLL